jgi:hypothetical protein
MDSSESFDWTSASAPSLLAFSQQTHSFHDLETSPCFEAHCTYHSHHSTLGISVGINLTTLWLIHSQHFNQAANTSPIFGITHAGGWHIAVLDCDPVALDQEIRLVFVDPNLCDHIHSGRGIWHLGSTQFDSSKVSWSITKYSPGPKTQISTAQCGKAAFSHLGRM